MSFRFGDSSFFGTCSKLDSGTHLIIISFVVICGYNSVVWLSVQITRGYLKKGKRKYCIVAIIACGPSNDFEPLIIFYITFQTEDLDSVGCVGVKRCRL